MATKTKTTTDTTDVVSIAKSAVAGIQEAIASLVQKRTETREKRTALLERAAKLYDTPLSPSEVKQFMCEMIDVRARAYADRLVNFNLLGKLSVPVDRNFAEGGRIGNRPPINFEDAELCVGSPRLHGARTDSLRDNGWTLPIFISYGEFEHWPYFFFGDAMKEKLSLLMDEMDATPQKPGQEGQPQTLDGRRQELADIRQQVHTLEQELGAIDFEISTLTKPIISGAQGLSSYALGAS